MPQTVLTDTKIKINKTHNCKINIYIIHRSSQNLKMSILELFELFLLRMISIYYIILLCRYLHFPFFFLEL